jgi:hypothetical protein
VEDGLLPIPSRALEYVSKSVVGEEIKGAVCMSGLDGFPTIKHTLELERTHKWRYQTDEFHGVCEIAHDDMTVKVTFAAATSKFYDVLAIDGVIKAALCRPVSVERLAEQLADFFPDLSVTVEGRAKTHGWISSTIER